MTTERPTALLFDVFGTVVDWRGSVMRDLQDFFEPRQISRDWETFALDWRALYQPAMEQVRSGARPYAILDILHRENLDELLRRYDIDGLDDRDRDQLTMLWHRLDPWPDSSAGLRRLRKAFWNAPVSNGNTALMINLARHGGFVWDTILGADTARNFKPRPEVYLKSATALGLPPAACMMVAAHNDDLTAAANLGFQTAFVCRPFEYGPKQTADTKADREWTHAVSSLTELADRLVGPEV
ncbi:MAG: haloacid dehalogenase type II [Pseudomonadota bacterium]